MTKAYHINKVLLLSINNLFYKYGPACLCTHQQNWNVGRLTWALNDGQPVRNKYFSVSARPCSSEYPQTLPAFKSPWLFLKPSSFPGHGWPSGPADSSWWGCPVRCRMCRSIHGLYPLDTGSTPSPPYDSLQSLSTTRAQGMREGRVCQNHS